MVPIGVVLLAVVAPAAGLVFPTVGAARPLASRRTGPATCAATDPVASLFASLFAGGSGKRIFFGVLQQKVNASDVPGEQERALRREAAADQLVNIDMPERDRRRLAGTALSVCTAALAVGLVAAHAPPLTRFAIAPPLFLSYGYLASAETGL